MQPSSLVFLVIIAVWAAFFVQYWVRRREHLSTARSVDQFSEAMRVLERRSPLPVTDLSVPAPRSYAVQPARPARAQILVKRADTTPALSGSGTTTGAAFDERTAVQSGPSSATGRASARRTRAMVMLGALSTVVVAVPLLVMGLLPWWVSIVPVGCVGIAVAFARATARVERQARATQPRSERVRRSAPAVAVASQAVASPAVAEPVETVAAAASDGVDVVTQESLQASPPAAPRTELYDVQAVEAARVAAPAAALPELRPVAPRQPLVDEDDIPLTWDPVPVPRPTYTMKSRVTRPAPTSADLVGDADTEYTAYEEPVRRVAGA